MKKIRLCLLIVIICLSFMGFTRSKQPKVFEGIYDVKHRTLAYFDLFSGEMNDIKSNMAEMFDSFPDDVTLDFLTIGMQELSYGRVSLGNDERQVWFLLARRGEEWPLLYVDTDGDGQIRKNEQVKGFWSGSVEKKGIKSTRFTTATPVGIDVFFRNDEKTVKRRLCFYITVGIAAKDEKQETFVGFFNADFFDGQLPIVRRGKKTIVNFRIVDGNGNGCFNDYERDLLYIDVDKNGYFVNKECWALSEYFFNDKDEQLKLVIPTYPQKILIAKPETPVNRQDLEAKPDVEAQPK